MPAGLCDPSLQQKNNHPLWSRKPRNTRTNPCCKLNRGSLHSSLQCSCPYAALLATVYATDAKQAFLRPSGSCTFLCRLCARFNYSQTACKANPAGTTQTGPSTAAFFWLSFASIGSFFFSMCLCRLQVISSQA